VSSIGGWSVWPLLGRVQRPSRENGARRCMAMSLWCTRGLGKGGFASVVSCCVGVRDEQGQAMRVCLGTWCTLWARWAATWHRTGMDGRWCTATLEQNWLEELVCWVKARLAAK
jgi:hypothetical protein